MTPTEPTNWYSLGVLTLIIAPGLLFSAAVIFVADLGEAAVEPDAPYQQCQHVDRARVAQLVDILERNRPTDAPVLERAVDGLNLARRDCQYGWNDNASRQYSWLKDWLDEQK